MDHKSTASRTALSFTLSILFHVSLVAGGAVLGAFFVKNQSAPQAKGEQTFEVNYSEPQQAVAEAAPEVVEAAPAKIVEAPAAAPTQPPPPVAKKAPTKKAKKIVVADFSEAQVPAQAPIEVNESLNEPVAETSSDDMAAAAQAEESVVKSEDIKEEAATEVAAEETAEEVAEQKAQQKSEETSKPVATPTPAPVITEVAAAPAATAPAEKAGSPTGDANATSAAPAQDEAPTSKEAPQNFLTLKQAPGNRAPSYPNELRKQQVQGKGQLKYYVNKDGRIGQMELTQSTGSAELDKVALDAFSKYKFVPGQEGYTVHNFEFSLKGPAEAEPRRLRTTYNQ